MRFKEYIENIDKSFIKEFYSTGAYYALCRDIKNKNKINLICHYKCFRLWSFSSDLRTRKINVGQTFNASDWSLDDVKELYKINTKIPWKSINKLVDKIERLNKDF